MHTPLSPPRKHNSLWRPSVGLMSFQRLRRWPNIKPTLRRSIMFSGFPSKQTRPDISWQTRDVYRLCLFNVGLLSATLAQHYIIIWSTPPVCLCLRESADSWCTR